MGVVSALYNKLKRCIRLIYACNVMYCWGVVNKV